MTKLKVDLANMKMDIELDKVDSISITKEGISICSNGMKFHVQNEASSNQQITANKTSSNLQMTGKEATQAGFAYKQENGGITITKYTGDQTHVVVPAYIDGVPVKQISQPCSVSESGAFEINKTIQSVVLPETLEVIEYAAFGGCSNLNSVNIPDSVTSIEGDAFWRCKSLSNVVIPDSVTNIEEYVFYGCSSLRNVVIPNSVRSIGIRAFGCCTSLSNVVIPDSVTSIGEHAFYDVPYITYHGTATNPDPTYPNWGAKSMN